MHRFCENLFSFSLFPSFPKSDVLTDTVKGRRTGTRSMKWRVSESPGVDDANSLRTTSSLAFVNRDRTEEGRVKRECEVFGGLTDDVLTPLRNFRFAFSGPKGPVTTFV